MLMIGPILWNSNYNGFQTFGGTALINVIQVILTTFYPRSTGSICYFLHEEIIHSFIDLDLLAIITLLRLSTTLVSDFRV